MFGQQRSQQIAVAGRDETVPAVQCALRQRSQHRYFGHRSFLPLMPLRIDIFEQGSNRPMMTDENDKRARQDARFAKDSRQDRLKLKLRENLKRRRSQARERSKKTGAPSHEDETTPHDGTGTKPGE
jgi:hypothetical protein